MSQRHLAKPVPVVLSGACGHPVGQVLDYFERYYLEQGITERRRPAHRGGNALTLYRGHTKASQGIGGGGMMKTRDGVVITVEPMLGGSSWRIEGTAAARLAQRLGFLGLELSKSAPPPPPPSPLPVGDEEDRVPCPFCAERILPRAKICRYCGSDVVAGSE